ncbi:YciI family protein, partial [Streptomyces sp. NPDC058953]|uniref:YciI family protein n=1 Tax=Streptomyces sp. NPDC058953 TaxID=3346676 RepID=UPI0036AA9D01
MTTRVTETTPAADERLFTEMAAFVEELTASGVLLATGGLAPEGVRVSLSGDEITVTDGPFTEAKEAVAGGGAGGGGRRGGGGGGGRAGGPG